MTYRRGPSRRAPQRATEGVRLAAAHRPFSSPRVGRRADSCRPTGNSGRQPGQNGATGGHGMTDKPTLNGCELTSRELELVRAEIESLDVIERATDEMRELIASRWPHL